VKVVGLNLKNNEKTFFQAQPTFIESF